MQDSLEGQITESIKEFATRPNAFGKGLEHGKSPAGADILGYLIENARIVSASGEAEALMAQEGILPVAVIVYPELGLDAIDRLAVKALPLIVANDAHHGDLYEEAVKA